MTSHGLNILTKNILTKRLETLFWTSLLGLISDWWQWRFGLVSVSRLWRLGLISILAFTTLAPTAPPLHQSRSVCYMAPQELTLEHVNSLTLKLATMKS